MGKTALTINIPAPTNAAARAMWPGLVNMEEELQQVYTQYNTINNASNGSETATPQPQANAPAPAPPPTKRRLSPAARKKISDATRKRHAEARAAKAAEAKKSKPKTHAATG